MPGQQLPKQYWKAMTAKMTQTIVPMQPTTPSAASMAQPWKRWRGGWVMARDELHHSPVGRADRARPAPARAVRSRLAYAGTLDRAVIERAERLARPARAETIAGARR